MSSPSDGIAARVRALAEFLVENDLQSVSIERSDESFEVARVPAAPAVPIAVVGPAAVRVDQIVADRVGIFHLTRPVPFAGEVLDGDRELAYVEQLGIRNPIRNRGAGRVTAILQRDGDVVDYGRALFEIERS